MGIHMAYNFVDANCTHSHLEFCSVAIDCSVFSSQSVVAEWYQFPGKAKACAIGILVSWCHPLTNGLAIQNLQERYKTSIKHTAGNFSFFI